MIQIDSICDTFRLSRKSREKNLHKSIEFIVDAGVIDKLDPTESCAILKRKRLSAASGNYKIYPKGLDSPVTVHCDMTSKNGIGVIEIGHDSDSRTRVSGYEDPGSYRRSIAYNLKMKEIVAIIKQSRKCEQFIKYECRHSKLWEEISTTYSWWVSRQGLAMNYWQQWQMCLWDEQHLCRWGKMQLRQK